MSNEVEELAAREQRVENLQRKAKRSPQWRKAAKREARELLKVKKSAIAELEKASTMSGMSPAARAATRRLTGQDSKVSNSEVEEELTRQRHDVAELERCLNDEGRIAELSRGRGR